MTTKYTTVNELVGVFVEATKLRNAISALETAGFARSQLGILASEQAVQQQLGDLYQRANAVHDPHTEPAIAFVSRDEISEVAETARGSLYFVGASGVAGALVASAAVLGGGLFAALGGVPGVGLVGLAAGAMIHQTDAEELRQRVDEGHILLFVRLPDGASERPATDILLREGATSAKVYAVPVTAGEGVAAD